MPSSPLHAELSDLVASFLDGRLPVRALSRFISANVQSLATADAETYRLYDLVTAYEAEHDLGDITEEEMREAIRHELKDLAASNDAAREVLVRPVGSEGH
jgi:hypothetical protein